jgi:antitoxin component YwqK of YwqJK toxin-antitoxin module
MNGFFKFVEAQKRGTVRFNTPTAKGSIAALNLMVNHLATIDYSESTILNNGKSKHYSEDGIIESVGLKIGDNKNGFWEYFHPNGKLKISCSYIGPMSNFHDLYQEFDNQGRLIKKVVYFYGDAEGEFKTYEYWTYEKNDYQSEYTHNTEGIKNGLKSTFKNNILVETRMFENGIPSSEKTMYHSNGKILATFNTINGKINGHLKEYYENGKIKEEGEYINNKKNGVFKIYNENGKFIKEENYINGIKQ